MNLTHFLEARWSWLTVLTFRADPLLLLPHIPAGLEVDLIDGESRVGLVAFDFSDARLLGIRVPFHHRFAELNLRFYVRRRVGNEWRRGIVFLREICPRRAV